MKARVIVVNLRTVFLVYCPECHSVVRAESLLDAETVRGRHVCPEPPPRLSLRLPPPRIRRVFCVY
jgi:hypothetical protein